MALGLNVKSLIHDGVGAISHHASRNQFITGGAITEGDAMVPDSSSPSQVRPGSRRSLVRWTGIAVLSLTVLTFSYWLTRPPIDHSSETDFLRRFEGGTLVIAGGGRLPPEIRQRFLDLAGGPQRAKIVVIPAYEADSKQVDSIRESWRALGTTSVRVLQAASREEADLATFGQPLDDATGVWLSGGQQALLSERYAGTRIEEKLHAVLDRGGVVGGSSAGAAAMTKVMIEQGSEEAIEGRGFDLFRDAIIDQHFLRRNRLNRLIGLLDAHPDRVAFGIDEGTSLVVQVHKGQLGVIGSSYVLACVPATESGTKRFEIMKHGDHIDFAGLKSGQMRVSSPTDLDAVLSDE